MKKITVLLVLLFAVVSVGSAQMQKRVSISTFPSSAPIGSASVQSLSNSVFSSNLPLINNLSSSNSDTPILPAYMVAETKYAVFSAPQDTSDSGFALTSRVDPNSRFTTGLYDIPTSINYSDAQGNVDASKVFGYGQFFPSFGTSGSLTIDTVLFRLFQYTRNGKKITPIKKSVLLIPYGIKANLQTRNGGEFSLDAPELRQLGTEIEISAETINNSLDISTNTIDNIVVNVPSPGWKVEAGETFGFLLYSQGATDTMRLFGTYLWELKDSTQTLGYALRRTKTSQEFATKVSTLSYPGTATFQDGSTLKDHYPSIADRALRVNYLFVVGGTLETTDGVETLTGEAKNFSLEQVAPNPVENTTKIKFSLQEPSTVSLRVVNSLGQIVKELAHGAMTTGTYSADFDATELPAGMYYYTLTAGTHSLTRSMVVVK
jgi:hypothetical protein